MTTKHIWLTRISSVAALALLVGCASAEASRNAARLEARERDVAEAGRRADLGPRQTRPQRGARLRGRRHRHRLRCDESGVVRAARGRGSSRVAGARYHR
jgi:hypothetical protein